MKTRRMPYLAVPLTLSLLWVSCSTKGPVPLDQSDESTRTGAIGGSVGDVAPDFELTSIDGTRVSLSELRGNPAVIVFWTAWCPVCKEEAPRVNDLVEGYGPRGVRVLGINIQDSPARTESGVRDFGIRYPVARDADASVARSYGVTGTPTVVILDRRGVVRYSGNELPPDYPARLDRLIGSLG